MKLSSIKLEMFRWECRLISETNEQTKVLRAWKCANIWWNDEHQLRSTWVKPTVIEKLKTPDVALITSNSVLDSFRRLIRLQKHRHNKNIFEMFRKLQKSLKRATILDFDYDGLNLRLTETSKGKSFGQFSLLKVCQIRTVDWHDISKVSPLNFSFGDTHDNIDPIFIFAAQYNRTFDCCFVVLVLLLKQVKYLNESIQRSGRNSPKRIYIICKFWAHGSVTGGFNSFTKQLTADCHYNATQWSFRVDTSMRQQRRSRNHSHGIFMILYQ